MAHTQEDNTLKAVLRTEFGKGPSRRARRDGLVPAVLYGHGVDPIHVNLPGHETLLALRQANALLTIDIAGAESQLALPKQVQRDPIRGNIEHVDLIIVRRGEKVTVDIALVVTGEAEYGSMVIVEHPTVSIEAEATHIPEEITVSVEGLAIGTQITLGELKLPAGSTIAGDPDALAVNITHTPTAQVDTPAESDTAEAAGADEGSDKE